MSKKNIAVLMGGYSGEYPISIESAKTVYEKIPKEKYNVYKVLITKEKWVLLEENSKKEYPIDKRDFSAKKNGKNLKFDFIFNVIHGEPCENGQLIAYFELLKIPHSSDDFYKMALTFNKKNCLAVAEKYGIKTAKSYFLKKGEKYNIENIIQKIGLPCFVKPNNGGSSLGASKVVQKENLEKALEKAFSCDENILIERFLEGKEVSVGVITYQGKVKVLPITEMIPDNDFFDFTAKYKGKSKEITPAKISETQKENIIKTAQTLYEKLGMQGFSRSEFILIKDTPYFLEMNTIPGMTPQSILPQQAKAAGISLEALLCDRIAHFLDLKK